MPPGEKFFNKHLFYTFKNTYFTFLLCFSLFMKNILFVLVCGLASHNKNIEKILAHFFQFLLNFRPRVTRKIMLIFAL